jgi:hypothetical protein
LHAAIEDMILQNVVSTTLAELEQAIPSSIEHTVQIIITATVSEIKVHALKI